MQHRDKQDARNGETQYDERCHDEPSLSRRFIDHDGQRHEDRENHKGDQQVCPECDPLDLVRLMPLQPKPDEGLDDLMGAEKRGNVANATYP